MWFLNMPSIDFDGERGKMLSKEHAPMYVK